MNRTYYVDHNNLLIELLQKEWHGFGPTLATEKLCELYSIKVKCRNSQPIKDSSIFMETKTKEN